MEEKRRREGGEEMIGQCERLGAELSEKGLSGRQSARPSGMRANIIIIIHFLYLLHAILGLRNTNNKGYINSRS